MTWEDIFKEERKKDYYQRLKDTLIKEESDHVILPKKAERLSAFELCPFEKVKVVIIGQDPYHNHNQAHGLSFSVKTNDYPPSLKNIYKELRDDLNVPYPNSGDLTSWAKQGVLLLNTVLTVRLHEPLSHKDIGWEELTLSVIKHLNERRKNIVYILWGSNARKYKQYIDAYNNLVVESVHPSPLSAHNGFFGSKPFSKTNEYLIKNNQHPINWEIK